jgi:hypothetical protein
MSLMSDDDYNVYGKIDSKDMCRLKNLHEPVVLMNIQLRDAKSVPYNDTGKFASPHIILLNFA